MEGLDVYERAVTEAWQHSKEIKKEFDRLMLEIQYKDTAVNKLAYLWEVDSGTIRLILKKEDENE